MQNVVYFTLMYHKIEIIMSCMKLFCFKNLVHSLCIHCIKLLWNLKEMRQGDPWMEFKKKKDLNKLCQYWCPFGFKNNCYISPNCTLALCWHGTHFCYFDHCLLCPIDFSLITEEKTIRFYKEEHETVSFNCVAQFSKLVIY